MRYVILDTCDPVRAARQFCQDRGMLWLDSADERHPAARWSYLCLQPVATLTVPGSDLSGEDDAFQRRAADIRTWIRGRPRTRIPGGPPFQGGVAGYVAYDAAPLFLDRFRSRHAPRSDLAEFSLYDTVLAFDLSGGKTWVMSLGLASAEAAEADDLADARIAAILARLETGPDGNVSPPALHWTRPPVAIDYAASVERTRSWILDGDIYQANIAQNWGAQACDVTAAFANYLDLRQRTPAPFAVFGHFAGRCLASASPERLISADAEGRVIAEPIKGTARRLADEEEDLRARQALEASEKDRAENIMITDLLRNDLSMVCRPDSVKVTSLCRLETFSNLHHLVSTIEGQLSDDRDGVDLFAAVFPGGSITGAPKLRAMEIIDEMELRPRGAYCGAVGYVGFDGALDFNILIRTIDHLPEESVVMAGGGITLMSDPADELSESELKAERIAPGLEKAESRG